MTTLQKPKAILFDMDGVLIDSERMWGQYEKVFWKSINIELTPEIRKRIYAISVPEEYDIMVKEFGLTMPYQEYENHYDVYAQKIYAEAALAQNLEKTLATLRQKDIKLGIVSASLTSWINLFLKRLDNPTLFDDYISISTDGLTPKPAPAGYVTLAQKLSVMPSETFVVEDSNRGIQSGKNAAMVTIATSEFIDPTYEQSGYDYQIHTLETLASLI